MLTILIMMIKIRDYDDNDDCKNYDDGDEGDSSCAGASCSCSASGFGWSCVGGARFFTFLGDNHGPGDHDDGGQDI